MPAAYRQKTFVDLKHLNAPDAFTAGGGCRRFVRRRWLGILRYFKDISSYNPAAAKKSLVCYEFPANVKIQIWN